MRDTTRLFTSRDLQTDYPHYRRPTYYEVCLASQSDPLGGTQDTELADLCEAFDTIFSRIDTTIEVLNVETAPSDRLWRAGLEPLLWN